MIYLLAFYFAIVFTALIICLCIAFKVVIFIKNNNQFSQQNLLEDPTQQLPKIDLEFSFPFFMDFLITILFISIVLGWKIVYRALFNDDFITKSAFKIYIEILSEIEPDV